MSGIEVIRGLRGWTAVPSSSCRRAARARQGRRARCRGRRLRHEAVRHGRAVRATAGALRRVSPAEEAAVVTTPDFTVDLAAKVVTRDGEEIRLTPTEWGIVELLVRNRGKLVTQRQLLQEEVWGPQYGDETNYLRVHMAHIRRKLEPEHGQPRYFITEPGMGYRFHSGD